jgi:NAD(P)-dependent dehydrogenase (short-subunit alcohol dehydrogenase family)
MKSKMMNANKVWYVTGASKGLGLSLVKKLLAEGYRVAATSRSAAQLQDVVGEHEDFLALEVDLTDNDSIWESVQKAHKHFGSIDVVVNNAGYGIGGAAEELSDKEIKDCFDINVFATINVVQHVLPFMRAQGSGSIINIASIAGFAAAMGWGMYAATKFAVVGFTEVLAEEVRDFGIKVTVAEPGAFRTEFLSGASLVVSKNKIDAYESVRDSLALYQKRDGVQAGDPNKAAEVFIALAENPNPPVRLFMGTDAYARANAKLELIKGELEQWKELSFSTDFPA